MPASKPVPEVKGSIPVTNSARHTAKAPHARADICLDSYSLCPTITIPNLSLTISIAKIAKKT